MKKRIILMLLSGLCFIFNTTSAQETVEELELKAYKSLLHDKIQRILDNETITRYDLQDCFQLMEHYSDLSTTIQSSTKVKEAIPIPEKKWISWVDFNTYIALFIVTMLLLKLFEWIERRIKHKKRDFGFEAETNESIDDLWKAVLGIEQKLEQIKIEN